MKNYQEESREALELNPNRKLKMSKSSLCSRETFEESRDANETEQNERPVSALKRTSQIERARIFSKMIDTAASE